MAAPPYIVFRNPYGGLGLRTRTAEAARARIDGLLEHCAAEVEFLSVELDVEEPCSPTMANNQPLPGMVGVVSSPVPTRFPPDQLIAQHGHELDELAREAWEAFGAPGAFGSSVSESRGIARWNWQAEGATAAAALDAWYPFLLRYQALEFNEYAPRVSMRVRHEFLVRREGRPLPGQEFPRSGTAAHLSGRHASAFFDLVFPYGGLEPAFLDDYRAVCAATGLRLPPNSFRLNTPTKKGDRKLLKLPTFA